VPVDFNQTRLNFAVALLLPIFLGLFQTASLAMVEGQESEKGQAEYAPGQLIVKLKEGAALQWSDVEMRDVEQSAAYRLRREMEAAFAPPSGKARAAS